MMTDPLGRRLSDSDYNRSAAQQGACSDANVTGSAAGDGSGLR